MVNRGTTVWMSMSDDNVSTRTIKMSNDGINFVVIGSEPRTTFLTPTRIGVSIKCQNTTNAPFLNLLSVTP